MADGVAAASGAGTDVVKVRDQQRLEFERAPDGRLAAMTMVSRPQLLVPGGKYLPMGDVRFRVAAAGTADGPRCKACGPLLWWGGCAQDDSGVSHVCDVAGVPYLPKHSRHVDSACR